MTYEYNLELQKMAEHEIERSSGRLQRMNFIGVSLGWNSSTVMKGRS